MQQSQDYDVRPFSETSDAENFLERRTLMSTQKLRPGPTDLLRLLDYVVYSLPVPVAC